MPSENRSELRVQHIQASVTRNETGASRARTRRAMRMAATVASPSPERLPGASAPAHVFAEAAETLPRPIASRAEGVPLHATPLVGATEPIPALGSRKPKPLLMAAALGFVLGRVFGAISKSKSSR
jgi:hypothetical protein